MVIRKYPGDEFEKLLAYRRRAYFQRRGYSSKKNKKIWGDYRVENSSRRLPLQEDRSKTRPLDNTEIKVLDYLLENCDAVLTSKNISTYTHFPEKQVESVLEKLRKRGIVKIYAYTVDKSNTEVRKLLRQEFRGILENLVLIELKRHEGDLRID